MTKAFSHIYDGSIWKMDIQEAAGLFAIEWRDQEGSPYFSVIHYPSGRVLSDHIQYGDRWWTLAAVSDKQLLLQHYPQPEQGQTQGLIAIDVHTKEVLWEQFNVHFIELTKEGIAVKQAFSNINKVNLLETSSGQLLQHNLSLETLTALPRTVRSASAVTTAPTVPLTSDLVGPYFYLEQDGKELWGYHEKKDAHFRLMLAVVQNGLILHQSCLVDQLRYLLPEVFFVVNQQLFFIRNNKREIVSYFV
ncbi:DUF4905 domain-containing protein [Olivibacter sp. XZL3]|uniref:DUF4905 domain-containing protein n=1 Tax=Olivibacter sp. XZL3 TaxID=1735116 RepID=UPI0010664DB3|nr:DUF4905 domain-containing protein [Olivibacter sp. XZL3]